MGLAMGMKDPVEAALRTDILASIGKDWHDLARRQGRELGLVSGQQNSLALFFREAMRDQAMAAFTTVQSVPINRELPPPVLQRGQTHAQQCGHLSGLRWTGFSGQAPSLTSEAGYRP